MSRIILIKRDIYMFIYVYYYNDPDYFVSGNVIY